MAPTIRMWLLLLMLSVVPTPSVTQYNDLTSPQYSPAKSVPDKVTNASGHSAPKYRAIKVWLASITSVLIISAVGLLGVAMVPLVQKLFFSKIIQFLVALAVGTLTGDAFLHLIPHAIRGAHKKEEASKDDNDEFISVMRGLVALAGIFLFYFAEKSLSMISEYRAEKKANEEERIRTLTDPRRSENRRKSAMFLGIGPGDTAGASSLADADMFRRLSKITMKGADEDSLITTGISSKAMRQIDVLRLYTDLDGDSINLRRSIYRQQHITLPDIEEGAPQAGETKGHPIIVNLPKEADELLEEETNIDSNNSQSSAVKCRRDRKSSLTAPRESISMERKQHSHEVPGSMAAVAMMVIIGDGLHNFTDGLAIGVAFADSFSIGISTTIAVFCHELPHELGDFAVLLKTGMKVKQALFYNVVSSVLCFVGMFIGISMHNIHSATYWIFALAAGIFVYIALVDMLPELNSVEIQPGESRVVHMVIQIAGLVAGVGMMLLIAIFEDQIKSMLD